MITIYFSGTGNSQYIARSFAKSMGHQAYSIEDQVDFFDLLATHETIAFCYPIYTSDIPAIMKDFVAHHLSALNGKNLIILCTQLIYSGDGARVFTDLLGPISYQVLYAEHINMPNNICNLPILPHLPLASPKGVRRAFRKADRKLQRICAEIQKNVVRKRGFNKTSQFLGYATQRSYAGAVEERAKKDVRINDSCVFCGLCVRRCPTKNLEIDRSSGAPRMVQKGQCTLCYRCVNLCPQRAITVLLHRPVTLQYRGLGLDQGLGSEEGL